MQLWEKMIWHHSYYNSKIQTNSYSNIGHTYSAYVYPGLQVFKSLSGHVLFVQLPVDLRQLGHPEPVAVLPQNLTDAPLDLLRVVGLFFPRVEAFVWIQGCCRVEEEKTKARFGCLQLSKSGGLGSFLLVWRTKSYCIFSIMKNSLLLTASRLGVSGEVSMHLLLEPWREGHPLFWPAHEWTEQGGGWLVIALCCIYNHLSKNHKKKDAGNISV